MHKRAHLAVGLAVAYLATGVRSTPVAAPQPKKPAPPREPEVTRARAVATGTAPHQNLREAARRAGGQVWLDYRNARRAARGLPPLTQ